MGAKTVKLSQRSHVDPFLAMDVMDRANSLERAGPRFPRG
jgi:hypothetical protein